jgi:putative ABC transport system substrate-binding protein
MNKKVLVLIVGIVTLASVHVAEAQQARRVYRIGMLRPEGPADAGGQPAIDAFRAGLRELGYVEGQNIAVEQRYAEGKLDRVPDLAADLVRLRVDAIVAVGLTTRHAVKSAKTTPVVFGFSGDPVEAGIVGSLARPGGNATGVTFFAAELAGKRLELLREAVPGISRVAVLANPGHPGEQRELRETQMAARILEMTLQYLAVRSRPDFNNAFEAMAKEGADAVVAFPDALTRNYRKEIAEFATRKRLASVFGWAEFVEAGGLMSYGPSRLESWKRVAVLVDKVLRGTKPAELPVEQPMRFELVINLNTAKQIGLTIPPEVLMRANKVIK